MGKASKWFRKLFGRRNNNDPSDQTKTSSQSHEKRRWSFVKSCKEKQHHDRDHHYGINNFKSNGDRFQPNFEFTDDVDPGKRAVAVAAATTASAEAAVEAATQAAAVVVRMRSGSGSGRKCCYAIREVRAAVMIQAAFRGCLARKALRALKGLVRLQALVRGNIERKRTAKWLQRMQTLMRAQKRACIGRSQISELKRSNSKSSQFHPISPATPENFEHSTLRTNRKLLEQTLKLKRNDSKSKSRVIRDQTITELGLIQSESWANEQRYVEHERSNIVFDFNAAKTRFLQKNRNPFHLNPSALVSDQYNHTISKESNISSSPSCEIQSFLEPKNSFEFEEGHLYVINDSPQYFSTLTKCDSSKRSPFTPTKSDGSRSCFNGYPDYPNYMADTESSKAKVRSLSAPRQRPGCEKLSPTDRYSVHDFVEARSSAHSVSSLHASFIAKAYPGSGRLDSLGMPKSYIDY